MSDIPTTRAHLLGVILWPAFVAAVLGCLVFFAFFDPLPLTAQWPFSPPPGRVAAYSLCFFLCWLSTALSSALTWLLLRPAQRPPATLDDLEDAP